MIEPKLRFKADDGSQFPDWEEHNFGDLYKVCSGYAFKYGNYCDSGVALINGQSIQHGWIDDNNMNYLPEAFLQQYEDFALKENDIVLGLNRPITNGKLKMARVPKEYNNSLLYQRAGKIVCKKAVDDDFSYALLAREIFKFTIKEAAGSDQPFISTSKLNNWKIIVPSSEQEQQKMAEFLSTIDTVIKKQKETVSAWEERKKGVMQKLFSQEVRFKTKEGSEFPDWEEKKLGKVFTERTERSKGGESLLSVTIAQGIVKQSETDKRNITSENKSNYKIVKKNDLAYNTMRMWQGAEGVSEYDGIVSPAYTVITALDGNNSYFFKTMFKQTFMLQVFQRFSQGLTSDTWNLKFPAFSEIKCLIPCEDEQNKIAECVAVLDEVIEKQKATLAAWEELKKGLLQQMFV